MVAVILNGGTSTRMAPYSDEVIPKGLLPVRKNKNGAMDPLLFVQLEQLEEAGIRNVIVVANRNNEKAFRYAIKQFNSSLNVSVIIQDRAGQLNAVVTVARTLRNGFIQDDFLVIDGDTYLRYDSDFKYFVQSFERDPSTILTAICRVDRHDKYAMLTTDAERVLTIEEKPAEWIDKGMLAKIGILGIPRALLPIKETNLSQGTTDFIAMFLSTGLCAVRFHDIPHAKDIGTWDDYLIILERGMYL